MDLSGPKSFAESLTAQSNPTVVVDPLPGVVPFAAALSSALSSGTVVPKLPEGVMREAT